MRRLSWLCSFYYELCGVFTNLIGGWVGSKTGLRFTLVLGVFLQVIALSMLSGLSTSWLETLQVTYVVVTQGISGIAKDFTKLSAKSAVKILLPPDAYGALFRWVAFLTGSKNTLKGIGFFLGGFLLTSIGFVPALWSMVALLIVVFVAALPWLPSGLGKTKAKIRFWQSLHTTRAVGLLSAARLFLFGARDVWFVVGLPVFLTQVLQWSFVGVGTYLALWVIGYGVVQALTPKWLDNLGGTKGNDAHNARVWGTVLALVPLAIAFFVHLDVSVELVVVLGLAVFGVVFAVNSSIHSYLVLAYADRDGVSLTVGFYYMANAMGRLVGTLLSGLVYQLAGLLGCLIAASIMLAVSAGLSFLLPDTRDDVTKAGA